MNSIYDLTLQTKDIAAKAALQYGKPVFCSMTFEKVGKTMMGNSGQDAIDKLVPLGIAGIATESSAWRFTPSSDDERKGAQVDLVIRRADKMTHLCEMKFSENPYTIKSDYEKRLRERRELFMEVTGTSRGVVLTMITPQGLKLGSHNSYIHSEITSKQLFADLMI